MTVFIYPSIHHFFTIQKGCITHMEKLYEGKSKIVYEGEEAGTCVIRYKDTATAGNGVKKEDLPGKGKLNAEISNIIFQ